MIFNMHIVDGNWLPRPSHWTLPCAGLHLVRERGSAPKGGLSENSVKTPLVKCPSVQWQPDGLTIHTKKWLLGAGLLGAPPISLTLSGGLY